MNWVDGEMEGLNLRDKRRNARVVKVLESIAKSPQSSLPQSCQGWSDTLGAYRLFDNEAVSSEALIQPHYAATEERIRASGSDVILCIQDTSELDFKGKQAKGLGRLSYAVQRGMYLHPTLCVTPERLSLGITDCWMWARGATKEADRLDPPVKESLRWLEGYERVAEMAERCPAQRLLYVADREGDILALMQLAQRLGNPADWLIRARHNRALSEHEKLWDRVAKQPVLATQTFVKPRKRGEKARKIRQEIKVLRYTLAAKTGTPVDISLVEAREIAPPKGCQPLIWRLLTNRTVETAEQAKTLIDWYRCRWEIEMFFDVLKTGCRIEKLQLGTRERIEKALALFLIVAWRVMHLMRLGRASPGLPADLIFDPLEWKSAYRLNEQPLPPDIPPLNDVLRNIAKLGGFLARKGDGEPGAKSIWRGLQRIQDCIYGIQLARELGGIG